MDSQQAQVDGSVSPKWRVWTVAASLVRLTADQTGPEGEVKHESSMSHVRGLPLVKGRAARYRICDIDGSNSETYHNGLVNDRAYGTWTVDEQSAHLAAGCSVSLSLHLPVVLSPPRLSTALDLGLPLSNLLHRIGQGSSLKLLVGSAGVAGEAHRAEAQDLVVQGSDPLAADPWGPWSVPCLSGLATGAPWARPPSVDEPANRQGSRGSLGE